MDPNVLNTCIESLSNDVIRRCVLLVVTVVKCEKLTLEKENVEFKCEWLNFSLTKNELNIRYIRKVTHILIDLRF